MSGTSYSLQVASCVILLHFDIILRKFLVSLWCRLLLRDRIEVISALFGQAVREQVVVQHANMTFYGASGVILAEFTI
jgi:hypothetical protein